MNRDNYLHLKSYRDRLSDWSPTVYGTHCGLIMAFRRWHRQFLMVRLDFNNCLYIE